MAFIRLDLDIFKQFPELSDGARILYAFILYRFWGAETDESDGEKYITYHGEDDPRAALGISKRQLLYRSEELIKSGLIKTEGNGWSFKLKLGNKFVTKNEETEENELQNCNQDGDKNVTETVQNCHRDGNKNVTEPFNINIENRIVENRSVLTNTPPTIEEVKKEIAAKKYKIEDPEKFILYNEAREWAGVKSWKKALALWAKKELEHKAGPRSGVPTGAESGLIYDCPVEFNLYPAPDAERVNQAAQDAARDVLNDAVDKLMDLFGG
jgi:hypothetical protein